MAEERGIAILNTTTTVTQQNESSRLRFIWHPKHRYPAQIKPVCLTLESPDGDFHYMPDSGYGQFNRVPIE
jgi:hypothetical protein